MAGWASPPVAPSVSARASVFSRDHLGSQMRALPAGFQGPLHPWDRMTQEQLQYPDVMPRAVDGPSQCSKVARNCWKLAGNSHAVKTLA